MRPVADLQPGEMAIAAHCRECSRFWFYLIGTPERGLRRVRGYPTIVYHIRESGAIESDYPPGSSSVRVTNLAGPRRPETIKILGVDYPRLARERFRVTCHRRCGRPDTTLRKETLNRVFLDAVEAGHADAAL